MVGRSLATVAVLGAIGAAAATDEPLETPFFGVEFAIAGSASGARVAAVGDRFLVVWTDSSGTSQDVRGRIYRADDGEADGPPFVIAGDHFDEATPAVSSGNGEFLVAWTNVLEEEPFVRAKTEVRATRVDLSGAVRDPGGLLVRGSGPDDDRFEAGRPALAWNGSRWLVAWVEGSDEPDVTLGVVESDGSVDSPMYLGLAATTQPRIAASGARFLIVVYANDPGEKVAVLVGPEFEHEGGSGIASNTRPWDHAVAGNGQDFLVTYGCLSEEDDPMCVGAAGPRTYSIEIDGETGDARQDTRTAVSDFLDPPDLGEQLPRSAATFSGARWIIAREEFEGGDHDIFVDDELVFPSAKGPETAGTTNAGLIIAKRAGGVYGRFFQFGEIPGPAATPTATPTASPTPNSSPVATPTWNFEGEGDETAGGCACAVSNRSSSSVAALLGAALVIALRRRS